MASDVMSLPFSLQLSIGKQALFLASIFVVTGICLKIDKDVARLEVGDALDIDERHGLIRYF